MDPSRQPCNYPEYNLTNGSGLGRRESERMNSGFKRKHLDNGTESSLDCSSSSSESDGELSRLREENRKLRKLAKHYRRKYLNAKERLRDVCSLNIELQKRMFGGTPPQHSYETPPSSMTYPVNQQRQHYVMNPIVQQPLQQPLQQQESTPDFDGNADSDPEVVEIGEQYGYTGQEPFCELNGLKGEQILSEEKFREAVSYVQEGEIGDSMFVKNLAMAIWGRETLATRSVTGRRCMAIMHSKPKPPLSPNKLDYIKEKLIERVRQNEPHVSSLDLGRRVSKINAYIANKINHLSRKSVEPMLQASQPEQTLPVADYSTNSNEKSFQ